MDDGFSEQSKRAFDETPVYTHQNHSQKIEKNRRKIMKNKYLKIGQYNIKNQKNVIMTPLLTDSTIQKFNVLTVQKSGRNIFVKTSYNPFDNNFYLTHQFENSMKICFYINKNIYFESGKIKFSNNDLCTLKLNIRKNKSKILINIHNVYNSSSVNIGANDKLSTISLLSEALKNSEKHLMMNDFNFYHSYGKKSKIKKQHVGAKTLLKMMKKNALELILSINIIT